MAFFTRPDGNVAYRTEEGDTVSLIAYRHFGTQVKTTEAILERNPEIAALPAILPSGIVIIMPPAPTPAATRRIVNPWE